MCPGRFFILLTLTHSVYLSLFAAMRSFKKAIGSLSVLGLHANLAMSQNIIEYTANPNIGPGGDAYQDSPHFRVYSQDQQASDTALRMLEAAHECFIADFGFRSTGLSFNTDNAPYYKTNIYAGTPVGGEALGVLKTDPPTGMGYLVVLPDSLTKVEVTVHEYGHAIQYHSQTWVGQTNTGAWWETFAQWVADTYATSRSCQFARQNNGLTESPTFLNLRKTLGDSFQPIVDGRGPRGQSTHYEAWPFFTYLTNNPDQIRGLGPDSMRRLMTEYAPNSNETPLHTLQRILGGSISVQEVVGRYWARMAYVDIDHPQGKQAFAQERPNINHQNVEPSASAQFNSYTPIQGRGPQYMGANIIPLQATGGTVSLEINAASPYHATVAIAGANGVRYVQVAQDRGSASFDLGQDDECMLIIANTPAELITYDAFNPTPEVTAPLQYELVLQGATAA